MPNNNNTFVPGRHVTNGSISGIVLTQRGYLVRVLNTNTNTPFWFDAVDLRGTRGRPGLVHPSGLCQFDVNAFIASSHQFCQEGIRLLFGRQNDMEQARGTTIERNEVGFRADHARRGSILAQLAPDAWGDAEYVTARGILYRYSGTQLLDLAADYIEVEPPFCLL